MIICYKWSNVGITWSDANWLWSECLYIPPGPTTGSMYIAGVDATVLVQPWLTEPWNPYTANGEHDRKRKRLIKLICKVKGETYEEEKFVGDMKISIDDVKMVVKSVLNIDLDVKKLEE
jgi:hypothetical protein